MSSDETQIMDYYVYRETGSQTFTSSSTSAETLYDLEDIGDCEITYEISATGNKGFSIGFSSNELNNQENAVRGQVDGAGYYGTYTAINNSQTYTLYNTQYSANNYFAVTIRYVNGNITITHNGKTHTDNRTFNLRYLRIFNWNSAKTINYRNLIVKKL